MDTSRNSMLGELAGDAAMERADFLVQATDQFRKFLEANRDRIEELGGLTLIDEEPDYLSIAPDLTFRSRTRFRRSATERIRAALQTLAYRVQHRMTRMNARMKRLASS